MSKLEQERRSYEVLDRAAIQASQLKRLNQLLDSILPENQFYAEKLGSQLKLDDLSALSNLPFTTKAELAPTDSDSDFARNLTYEVDRYVRFHRTSGTSGRPMGVLDTASDWQWWIDTWQYVLDAASITANDRVFMAFSFGPFIGFWSAHEAVTSRAALAIPGGGLSSEARLDLILRSNATALFCTPTYALRLAEVAAQNGVNIADSAVTRIVVAGEPGGSIPSVRGRIENAWNAIVIDHAGASEVGPWGYPNADRTGLHICEAEFIAEFVDPETGQAANGANPSELVLTTLGRTGCPVIRYRTGDLVQPVYPDSGNRFVMLQGGVLGRSDDMLVIRGVNVFPSGIEGILRELPSVIEFRLIAQRDGEMDSLLIEVEDQNDDSDAIAGLLESRLGLRIDVACVELNSLPRFEAKGRRFVDQR
ncbi:MAG TPA: CoF synthetase [Planctomycetaceae bacterium]|nr:CoF synthetase [Rhodopirellula sp.]MCH2359926.1 phenylacetate--CoA ligase family protein [Pirellulales bacterium]HCK70048.1 CoF synthetase [Planctomycetaceae bacterium]HCP83314.1 CoF synthetase [Planctomycetaceae bacterium]|tara:strand:+ start:530 stop:1795 length:1266 start_codon:yes stop_codon:yes gene_type:complete